MISKRAVVAVFVLSACGGGDDGDDQPPPDGPPSTGADVRVEIYRDFPFVDGDTADEAQFVAVQDGDGAFVQATGSNGVYTVHIESEKYGVAVGCLDEVGNFVDIEIEHKTVSDNDLTYKTLCKTRAVDATLAVTVTNLQPGQRLRLRTNRNLRNAVADGTLMIEVPANAETELFGTLTDENRNVLKLFRIPSIQVGTSADVAIDVATDGVAPDFSGTFELTPDDENATIRTAVVRPYGTVTLTSVTNPIGTNRNYLMVPAALRQSDDLYRFTVSTAVGSASRTAKTPGALAFDLPTQFTAPNPELLETPFLHPVWTFDPTPAVLANQEYFLDASNFFDLNAPVQRSWFVTISSRWIGDATTVRYEFPDFSQMPGFAEIALVANERLDTTILRSEFSAAANVDGAKSTTSSAIGVIGKFCGDGIVIAPETCDAGELGETETCDIDCTVPECGDSVVNFSAGEDCDPPDGTTCSAQCTFL